MVARAGYSAAAVAAAVVGPDLAAVVAVVALIAASEVGIGQQVAAAEVVVATDLNCLG